MTKRKKHTDIDQENLERSTAGYSVLSKTEEPPKIEFPCDYPIKVLGDAVPHFKQTVIEVVTVHSPTLDLRKITLRDSGKGRFRSVTVVIRATGVDQLEAIFEDLKATGIVKMVI